MTIKKWFIQSSIKSDFLGEAKKKGYSLEYLEKKETYFQQLNNIPYNLYIKSLENLLLNPEAVKKEVRDLIQAYRRGKLLTLRKLILESREFKKNPILLQKVYLEPNQRWLPSIEKAILKGKTFIVLDLRSFIGKKRNCKSFEKKRIFG